MYSTFFVVNHIVAADYRFLKAVTLEIRHILVRTWQVEWENTTKERHLLEHISNVGNWLSTSTERTGIEGNKRTYNLAIRAILSYVANNIAVFTKTYIGN